MDNPETLSTLDTQDIGQYRDTVNIGHTRHRTKTIKTRTQHNTENNIIPGK